MSDDTTVVFARITEVKYDSKEARLNGLRALSSTEIASERKVGRETDSLWDVLTRMNSFNSQLVNDDDREREFGEVRSTSQNFEFEVLRAHSARLEYD